MTFLRVVVLFLRSDVSSGSGLNAKLEFRHNIAIFLSSKTGDTDNSLLRTTFAIQKISVENHVYFNCASRVFLSRQLRDWWFFYDSGGG